MSKSINALLLSGSLRRPSYTFALVCAIQAELDRLGLQTIHWDLKDHLLPIADPEFHDDPFRHPDPTVNFLVRAASSADCFVLGTPVYHNSYSGVLKNALDHLAIAQFRYKPVALASHGGNRSTQGVDQLRIVVRGLHGITIPAQACTAKEDYCENGLAGFELRSEQLKQRVGRLARELALFACKLRQLS